MSSGTSTKEKAKRWVKDILHKVVDDDEAHFHQPSPGQGHGKVTFPQSTTTLAESLNALNLTNGKNDSHFVGGFHPALQSGASHLSESPVLSTPRPPPVPSKTNQSARPPSMPFPQSQTAGEYSKTMQYALAQGNNLKLDSPINQEEHKSTSPIPATPPKTPSKSHTLASNDTLHTPVRPSKQRLSSTASLPSSPNAQTQTQCAAFTKAGKRCTRQVKHGPPLSRSSSSESGESESWPRYCFQHIKEINSATGFYARKNGVWIDYKNWIPKHLQADTQAALRSEMEKARSQTDVPGYIYVFEIRDSDPRGGHAIKFKVGRATNHVRRLDQWGKQCGSQEHVRLGVYPEPDRESSNLKGLQELDPTRKAAWCHRLERLIHLELADIVATRIYLDSSWPNPSVDKDSSSKKDNEGPEPCSDCGSVHKEIFEFKRISRGRYKGKEYELIVKPIIEKWGGVLTEQSMYPVQLSMTKEDAIRNSPEDQKYKRQIHKILAWHGQPIIFESNSVSIVGIAMKAFRHTKQLGSNV
ncbi:hypothetical protein AMATHDRAFT_85625 [Amanita thiersii Skay4041]|uniref:Bacteriophage T5 Orf172 DNA-binding domain-containing protein n=1 Tax=Amanita thiersii Skay4041 TaxID=703135 RepID=A0A2A9NSP3_9AGAR|nr:hypothetical protein AMATHDRAFT_85625 [Amanita thiersii Skay4041]